MIIQNSAAWVGIANDATSDHQTLYRNAVPGHDMKDAEGSAERRRHCQHFWARTIYCDVLCDYEFGTGQGDVLSMKSWSEINEITVMCIRERLAQRARAAVICVRNCYDDSARL